MSWADDNGVDGEPEFDDYRSEAPDDVWEDTNYNETPIKDLATPHLVNIIRGLEAGKSYWEQIDKLPNLRAELKKRETK